MSRSTIVRVGMIACAVAAISVAWSVAGSLVQQASTPSLIAVLFKTSTKGGSDIPILAICRDSTIVYSDGFSSDGALHRGSISSMQLKKLERAIEAVVSGTPSATYVVPDTEYYEFAIRIGNTTKIYRWDEIIKPGWGANALDDSKYLDFIATWAKTKALCAGVQVTLSGDHVDRADLITRSRQFVLDCGRSP